MTSHRPRFAAFTLIELLVVIAIIALLVGILLPALGKARTASRTAVCLSNTRQTSVSMLLYAQENKDWYPVVPGASTGTSLSNTFRYGGVAGLFSLYQRGEAAYFPTGDGYTGVSGNPDDAAYSNGNKIALLAPFVEGFGVLYCPADRLDAYYGRPYPRGASLASAISMGRTRVPRPPKNADDVVSYNISYLYIAGMKTDEAVILKPAVLWGDETLGPDVSTDAWYGAGGGIDNAMAGMTQKGFYGPQDNHGKDGANFTFTDGHSEFVKGNVHDTFFARNSRAAQSVNVVDPNRASRTETSD